MKDLDFSFKDIVELAKDVILVTKAYPIDAPGPEIVYVNKAFTELTGYTKEEIVGQNPRLLQSTGTDESTKRAMRIGLEQQMPTRTTVKNYSKTGEAYWIDVSILPLKNAQGDITHFCAIQRNVTEQKNIEEKLEILSSTDSLTGLLNRRAFDEILKNELSRFKRHDEKYSALMFDIDKFKKINDKYGHPVGDKVIQSVAESCQSSLRPHDKFARVGGEEFCILLPDTAKKAASAVAEKLKDIVSNTSISTANDNITVTVSIGVSEVEQTDSEHTALLDRADEKMYQAKNTGRNRVCV